MNEKTDVTSIDSTVLLEELSAQIEVWEKKASAFDRMKKRAMTDTEEQRLASKGGCFRGCATDLKHLLRDFTPSNK